MRNKQTLKWIASLGTSATVALLLADTCIAPAEHDVHFSDAISIRVQIADSQYSLPYSGPLSPSESLTDIRCQAWRWNTRANTRDACPDEASLAPIFWPRLTQSPKTLYVGIAPSCPGYINVEYLASSRTLIIHCHAAGPWISIPISSARGVEAIRVTPLVLVPTNAIRSGAVRVVQDDRLEHLIGDQVTESQLGTVNII